MLRFFLSTCAFALSIGAAAAALPGRAFAQDSAGATVLFNGAKDLMDRGRYAEACPKFEASYGLDKQLGTLLNWGDCLEKIHKLVEAEARFKDAYDFAVRLGDPRSEYAEKRRAPLSARFAKLRLDVKAGANGLAIYRDGVRVDDGDYGVLMPSDPLPTTLVVRRDDEDLETIPVTLAEGEERSVAIDLIAIGKAHPKKTNVELHVPQGQRTAAFVVGGFGIAGLIGFGVLEGLAYAKRSASLDPGNCVYDAPSGTYACTPAGFALHTQAGDLAEAGQWMGIGSAVVLGVGITLLASAPRGAVAKSAAIVPVVDVGQNGGFVGLRGVIE